MRLRALLACSVVIAVVVVAGFLATLATAGSDPTRTASVTVALQRDPPGGVQPVSVAVPGANRGTERVFLVHETGAGVVAFVGRSTATTKCALAWVHDPDRAALTTSSNVAFEDPCGGALYSLDGACLAGPCRRGLDHFSSRVADGRIDIDLSRLVPGAPKA